MSEFGKSGIARRTIERAEAKAVERLGKSGVATVHEAQGRTGLMNADHPDLVSGITTINPFKNKSDTTKMTTLVARLASDYNMTTALRSFPTPTGGTLTSVRVSTHLFHDNRDLDYVMNAIQALAAQIDV